MRMGGLSRAVNLLDIVNHRKGSNAVAQKEEAKVLKDTFSNELAKATQVNFSKHARERLFSRGIELSDDKMTQLSQAIDKAAVKGSKETLILDDQAAYVVSVSSRTVVTAFGRENLREGVVTSIDSAIIL
jgi:flagellar operon protein